MAGRYCEGKIKIALEKVSRKMVLEIKYVNANNTVIHIENSKLLLDSKINLELGFGPNLGWELGFGTPLHDRRLSLSFDTFDSQKSENVRTAKPLVRIFRNCYRSPVYRRI